MSELLHQELHGHVHNFVHGINSADSHDSIVKTLAELGHHPKDIEDATLHLHDAASEQKNSDSHRKKLQGAALAMYDVINKNTSSVHVNRFYNKLKIDPPKKSTTESIQILEGTAPKHKYVLDFERSHPLAKENTLETHSYIGDYGPEDMHVFDEQDKGNRIRHIIIHQKSRNRIYHQKITFKSGERFGRVSNEYYHAKTGEKIMESAADSMKHRIGVTVSDPNHEMTSKRKEKFYKIVRVKAESEDEAKKKAIEFYKGKGYKVHEALYLNQINEDLSGEIEMNENEIIEEHIYELLEHNEEFFKHGSFNTFKIPAKVPYKIAAEHGTTNTLEGPVKHEPGHYIMTGVKGENWPLSPENFHSKYDVASSTHATPKKIMKVAKLADHDGVLNTSWGNLEYKKGQHYLVRHGEGDYGAVEKDIFHKTYDTSNLTESFTSVDFINLLMEGKHLEAEQMFKTMVESVAAEKVEELVQEVAESMNNANEDVEALHELSNEYLSLYNKVASHVQSPLAKKMDDQSAELSTLQKPPKEKMDALRKTSTQFVARQKGIARSDLRLGHAMGGLTSTKVPKL